MFNAYKNGVENFQWEEKESDEARSDRLKTVQTPCYIANVIRRQGGLVRNATRNKQCHWPNTLGSVYTWLFFEVRICVLSSDCWISESKHKGSREAVCT